MDQTQSFNVTADFFSGFISAFIQLVFVIILVYLFISLLNFIRDKFINKETDTKKEDIGDLLLILNKLFFISGFGFIIANFVQFIFNKASKQNGIALMNFRSDWDYLTFGIILIFVGVSFKAANKVLRSIKVP